MSQSEFKRRLKVLMNKPENQVCSDCPERQPRWASLIVPPPGSAPGSLAMGAFTCLECSGSHRRLGVHIAFVRSVTLDSWKEKEVLAMENGGNQKVNAIFEANLTVSKPTTSANGQVRERFIRDKYERRKYFSSAVLQSHQQGAESSSDSESDNEKHRSTATTSTTTTRTSSIRAPSDAAKMRAQARKQRVSSSTSASPRKQSNALKKRQAAKTPTTPAAAPVEDLLDFGLPVTNDPGPPPNPPSATPSPTLDMFKELSVGGGTSTGTGTGTGTAGQSNGNASNDRNKKINDIMGLFNTPNAAVNNNNMGFNAFGHMNTGMNMAGSGYNYNNNNNMNNGMVMMQNQMGTMNNNNNNNINSTGGNGMMNNQMIQNSTSNQFMNHNAMMNSFHSNSNNHDLSQSGSGNNLNFFHGMQSNIMHNSSSSHHHHQPNKNGMHNTMQMNMNQSQNKTSDFMMTPMGGTPSNLNFMGGQSMGSNQQQQQQQQQHSNNDNSGFDVMGGGGLSSNNSGNPQMNQFASFGSFR